MERPKTCPYSRVRHRVRTSRCSTARQTDAPDHRRLVPFSTVPPARMTPRWSGVASLPQIARLPLWSSTARQGFWIPEQRQVIPRKVGRWKRARPNAKKKATDATCLGDTGRRGEAESDLVVHTRWYPKLELPSKSVVWARVGIVTFPSKLPAELSKGNGMVNGITVSNGQRCSSRHGQVATDCTEPGTRLEGSYWRSESRSVRFPGCWGTRTPI